MRRLALITLILFIIIFQSVNGADDFQVRIDYVEDAIQGREHKVDVILDYADSEIGGFDFLIKYDPDVLAFWYCTIGHTLSATHCGWEYFTYRFGPNAICEDCPKKTIHLVAIADIINGPNYPNCYTPESLPAVLFSMNFLVTNDRTYECSTTPIQFYWGDCDDNLIFNSNGDTLWAASELKNTVDICPITYEDILNSEVGYPTHLGPQDDSCHLDNPVKSMTLINGAIEIICADPISAVGDINLNGYIEPADMVLFVRYFLGYLPDYFNEAQIQMTDMNDDGETLKIEDFILLMRSLLGDLALCGSYDIVSPNTATVSITDEGVLSVNSLDSLGGMFIKLKGYVIPIFLKNSDDQFFLYNSNNSYDSNTCIFMSSHNLSLSLTGDLLGNIVNTEIIEIQVATNMGSKVIVQLDNPPLFPDNFMLEQNYPNPFNNSTKIAFSIPYTSIVNFDIINILGEKVYSYSKQYPIGRHFIEWDGVNNKGDAVASGVYYYRITTDDFVASKKLMLLK